MTDQPIEPTGAAPTERTDGTDGTESTDNAASADTGNTESTERIEPAETRVVPPGLLPGWDRQFAPTAAEIAAEATRQDRFGISLPTVIWGLLFALAASAIIVDQASDTQVDLGVAVPLVLLGAGAALVAWGIAGLARRRA